MKTPKLITPNEAAKIKGVTRQAIHAAMNRGRLKYVTIRVIESQRRITPEALAVFSPNPNMRGRKAK